jgi:hypothetical protein
MTVRERIALCRVIEKIDRHEAYSKSIGVSNESKFKGKKCVKSAEKSKDNK